MIIWELRLFDQAGERLATWTQWPDLVVDLAINAPTKYALRLNGNDERVALFELDGLLEGWWCDDANGLDWRREFCCWTVDRHRWTDGAGARQFVSSGFGLEHLLQRDIIDTYAGSAASKKSDVGESVIKDFVYEQCGPGAGGRARSGLTVEADHSPALGSAWSGQRSNKRVLETIQEIAEATGLQFGIARTDTYAFEFQVWEPTDARATVIFSEERLNMKEPDLNERYSAQATNIKVSGAGQGDLRETIYLEDATAAVLSPQHRYELFVDARDQDEVDEYTARGQEALDANRAAISFDFRVLQAPATLYGRDYQLGDYVTAKYAGQEFDRRVNAVSWHVSAGETRVDVKTVEMAVDDGS